MSNLIDRGLSAILTLAAVAMAGSLMYGELHASSRTARAPNLQQPVEVKGWNDLLSAGTLIGDSLASVRIVEFADFECPYCRQFETAYRTAKTRFGPRIALTFINDPLSRIHRFAMPAARAVDCAAKQGRFSALHDVIYEKQDSLGLKPWVSFAADAGIQDTAAFLRCNAATGAIPAVEIGQTAAKRFDVRGTPTVVINGWRLTRPPNDSELVSIVADILAGQDVRKAVASAQQQ